MTDPRTWMPPTSTYQTESEQMFAQSTLRYDDGRLIWLPCGMRQRQVGSRPFDVEVGAGPGQAHELVWIFASRVVPSRGSSPQVDVIAICSKDPMGPGGRRVLGYLPATLVKPYTGRALDGGDNLAAIEAGAKAIAATAGLEYTEFNPPYGSNRLNVDFPGAYPALPRLIRGTWINAMMSIGLGLFIAVVIPLHHGPNPLWLVLLLSLSSLAAVILGVVVLPPVTRRLPAGRRTRWRRM